MPKNFKSQTRRSDIVINILSGFPYETVLQSNGNGSDKSRLGFIYETIAILMIISKVTLISYINVIGTAFNSYPNLTPINDIRELINCPIPQGNDCSDLTLEISSGVYLPFSIKYRNNSIPDKWSIKDLKKDAGGVGFICKDKNKIINHHFNHNNNTNKIARDSIIADKLLFDETDVKKWYLIFQERFRGYNLEQWIDEINSNYLGSPRKSVLPYLHQKMFVVQIISNILAGYKDHLIDNKPRSGKSLLVLLTIVSLIKSGYKKFLIMSSVPHTFKSFIEDLNMFIEFRKIKYVIQKEFLKLDKTFEGIVFCSVQYLKKGQEGQKIKKLEELNFDVKFFDESHSGSSTDRTYKDIVGHNGVNIFVSGTGRKTRNYYKIPSNCVYKWGIMDEVTMKDILEKNQSGQFSEDLIQEMCNFHGHEFRKIYSSGVVNIDYSHFPKNVLIKPNLADQLKPMIVSYNNKYGTNYGYDIASLLALEPKRRNSKKGSKYKNKFEICNTTAGEEMLVDILSSIISEDANRLPMTIMKIIEETQSKCDSRKSTKKDPKMFIIYLPINNRKGTISQLQKTLLQFLKDHQLWSDYQLEYISSKLSSGDCKEDYYQFLDSCMTRTRNNNKRGCILFLGNTGSVGITYKLCDVTISLDNGCNIDTTKQKFHRALTPAKKKTIGINVDMNVQRTYKWVIHNETEFRLRKNDYSSSRSEIIEKMYNTNVFIYNPHEFDYGIVITEITNYYKDVEEEIYKELDAKVFIDDLTCEDTLKDIITCQPSFSSQTNVVVNPELEGLNPDLPQAGTTGTIISSTEVSNIEVSNIEVSNIEVDDEQIIIQINHTNELLKCVVPGILLIMRTYLYKSVDSVLENNDMLSIIYSIMIRKIGKRSKNELKNILEHIIVEMNSEQNVKNVQKIKELYKKTLPSKLRELIAEHYIPSQKEMKEYAEIATPPTLVDDMLAKISEDFWKKLIRIIEPCCGKGNFILGIFDKMYYGLSGIIEDKAERCRIIIEECLFFCDINSVDVSITKMLLMCHAHHYCGIYKEYKFNSNVGNTLELDIKEIWGIDNFDAVIGNPPYNTPSKNKGRGHILWDKFVNMAYKWIKPNGYLLYVHPSSWRQIDHKILKMFKKNQLHYLEIHNVDDGIKTFKCSTRYDWYLLEKTNKSENTITTIKDEEGKINKINLDDWDFIPNMKFEEIKKLISNNNEKLDVNYYRSNYGADKKWVQKEKKDEFKYPVVYTINKDNVLSLRYSKINNKGHFGKSKFIFSNGAGFYCDKKGEYGITQWAYCIYDEPDNLSNIKTAFRSNKFKLINKALKFDSSNYNINVMKRFKKDFWVEFV